MPAADRRKRPDAGPRRPNHARRSLLPALVFACLLVGLVSPEAAFGRSAVTLEPASGPAGAATVVRGTGFRPGTPVPLWIGGAGSGQAVADARGSFEARVTIPAGARRAVRVRSGAGSRAVSNVYRIKRASGSGEVALRKGARLRWGPVQVTVRGGVSLRGKRLPARRRVRVRIGSRVVRTVRARRGRFAARVRVPSLPAGRHRGTVRAGRAKLVFHLDVAPRRVGSLVRGASYYVDPASGDDNRPGTSEAQAWRTLERVGGAALNPGDRVLLKRGGSWSGKLEITRSGAPAAPIVVSSYGDGPRPRITGRCVALRGSHVVVRGLHLDGCSWAGVDLYGSETSVEDSLITQNVAGVFVHPGARASRVVGNTILDNKRLSPDDADSGAFGVLLQGEGAVVAHNTISGHDTASARYGRDGAAVEVYGARHSHVHHNLAVDNLTFTELGDPASADNTFAYNVVRSALETSTFVVTRGGESGYGPVVRTRLFNNSVLMTGARSEGFICHGGCGPSILTMRNNVIQAVVKAGYADAPFDEDYNLYHGGIVQFAKGPHSVVADPGFVSLATADLRLRPNSPAIDAGTSVSYDRDFDGRRTPLDGDGRGGAARDMGAFEFRR